MNIVYAKSTKNKGKIETETLEEHIKELLHNLSIFQQLYQKEIIELGVPKLIRLLELASLFHDLGKVCDQFQNKIRKAAEKDPVKIKPEYRDEIRHNFLSPSCFTFIPEGELTDYEDTILFYAVALHHNRKIEFNADYLKTIIHNDLKNKIHLFDWLKEYNLMPTTKLRDKYFNRLTNPHELSTIENNKDYILLKGLLHRLDHASSAHVPVEVERIKDIDDKLLNYLKNKSKERNQIFTGLKPFQELAKTLRNKSVMLIASTGLGKTEFALTWIGKDKAFYTLPLKVSVTDIHLRFMSMFSKDKIGLLYGDTLLNGINDMDDYLVDGLSEDQLAMEEHIYRTHTTRQFAMPLTVSTADQLFTSVFKWKGYEKIYATMIYSKVIVDEPQSYSPDILAMIIKGLQEISKLGGKFCFMSATIHPFIKTELKDYCEILEPVYHNELKNKLQLVDDTLDSCITNIIQKYNEGKKILVICNTIRKAQNLFTNLRATGNVRLLHSEFIQRDRRAKEKDIKEDYEKDIPVIWITTQLVEASLDIDYDILFTELATIDSLIQRMGRIYRRLDCGRTITEDSDANVIIATKKPSGITHVYNKDIVELTKDALLEYNGKIITEPMKQQLMDTVFTPNPRNQSFYNDYSITFNLLNSGFKADNKSAAQELFRNIFNINVIPLDIFNDNEKEINEYVGLIKDKNTDQAVKWRAIKDLNDLTVSVNYNKIRKNNYSSLDVNKRSQTFLLNAGYDPVFGILYNQQSDNFM